MLNGTQDERVKGEKECTRYHELYAVLFTGVGTPLDILISL